MWSSRPSEPSARKWRPVGPRAGHGIEGVAEADDTGRVRDVGPVQAPRVALSIKALVVALIGIHDP
jgi:hypothetical protein